MIGHRNRHHKRTERKLYIKYLLKKPSADKLQNAFHYLRSVIPPAPALNRKIKVDVEILKFLISKLLDFIEVAPEIYAEVKIILTALQNLLEVGGRIHNVFDNDPKTCNIFREFLDSDEIAELIFKDSELSSLDSQSSHGSISLQSNASPTTRATTSTSSGEGSASTTRPTTSTSTGEGSTSTLDKPL